MPVKYKINTIIKCGSTECHPIMERKVIHKNRSKLIYYCFVAVLGITVGFIFLFIPGLFIFLPLWFINTLGILCIVLFTLGFVYMIKNYFEDSPGIVLDSTGLTDNTSAFSPGHIPWKQIIGFRVRNIYSTPLLGVKLVDPYYLSKNSFFLVRFNDYLNHKICGSSILISVNTLEIEFDSFVELVKEYHGKYRG